MADVIFFGYGGDLLEFLGSMANGVFMVVPDKVLLVVDVGGCLSSVGMWGDLVTFFLGCGAIFSVSGVASCWMESSCRLLILIFLH